MIAIAEMPFKRTIMHQVERPYISHGTAWVDAPLLGDDTTCLSEMRFLWTAYDDLAFEREMKEKRRIRDWPAQEVLRHPPIIACQNGHRHYMPEIRRKALRCDRKGIGLRIGKDK